MILVGLETLFHLKKSDLRNIQWFHALYSKLCEKVAEIWLYEKRYKFEIKQSFLYKLRDDNFKTHKQSVVHFQVCIM